MFIFSVKGPGTLTVTFEYARSFESGADPVATVTIAYTVDNQLNVTKTSIGGDHDEYAADENVTVVSE